MKLLIVDDEKVMREYIRFIIKEENMEIEVMEASNGEEALKLAKEFQPQVILLDIKMPQVNGIEALEMIRQQLPSIKVVLLSAYDKFEYAQKALRLGASDYLLKPIAPKDLKDLLEKLGKENQQKESKQADHSEALVYEEDIIVKAKSYIEEGYPDKIQLQDIASHVGLSPTYFSKFFKQKTQKNFSRYLNEVRIGKAKELMKNPNLSLNEISYRVGYEDLSYFSIVFQRQEGITPTGYRRRLMAK